jgi:hypothetical protein
MGDKRTFEIGQLVEVNLNHEARADYEDNVRIVKRKINWTGYKFESDDLVLAKITGVKHLQEGVYNVGSEIGYGMDAEYEPAYFTSTHMVMVWLVRLGYKNKEKAFFEKDINVIPANSLQIFNQYICTPKDMDIPFFYGGPYTDGWKKKMSRESKDWPRASNGRWSK